jgi:hypothetical protein
MIIYNMKICFNVILIILISYYKVGIFCYIFGQIVESLNFTQNYV